MRNSTTIYERIYSKLLKLIPELETFQIGDDLKSKVDNFMDLNLDVLMKDESSTRIALSHYYESNGDLVADPDMEIRVYFRSKMAEALTYQDTFGYQRVYLEEQRFYPDLKKKLNIFLNGWLGNCLEQGHLLKRPVSKTADSSDINSCSDDQQ